MAKRDSPDRCFPLISSEFERCIVECVTLKHGADIKDALGTLCYNDEHAFLDPHNTLIRNIRSLSIRK